VAAVVESLAIAPVKGLRVVAAEWLDLTAAGPAGDRAFLVVDPDGALLLTTRTPKLLQVEPRWDPAAGTLTLRFPDGEAVTAVPRPGAAAATTTYDGRRLAGRLVDGPLADALSMHLGRPVRLLARDPAEVGGDDAPVTLSSTASLRALAPALDGAVPDARRFRMTITVDGLGPWAEHGWSGREVTVGEAVLGVREPVPRCVVTTRDPDTGRRDAPVLAALAALRGRRDVTFGVWCDVLTPGRVRRGDAVRPATPRARRPSPAR
jgi:uncharacterized protein YcbX